MLKKTISAISLCILQSFFLISSISANQEYIEIDRIVAIAEKDTISKNQLNKALDQKKYNWQKQGKDLPDEQILIKETLDELINKSIIMQYANNSGIKISQEQLISVIQNIANQHKLSIDNLKKNIESNGGNFALFKDQIYFELTINQLKRREITSKLIISEFEIDNFLALKKKITPENYNLSHILIEIPDNLTQEETSNYKKKINETLKALDKKTFEEVAIEFSDGEFAKSGGNLGWKKPEDLPATFIKIIENLNIGEISKPFKSGNGFHIFKLNGKKGNEYKTIYTNQSKVRHILIKQNEVLSEDTIRKKLNHIKNQIAQGLTFTDAAKKYSEDGTAANGGDLGWISSKNIVPEFENIINSLDLKKLSDPVQTNLGWHIIEVLDRRILDTTEESKRLAAKNELLQQKTNIQFQDWINTIKERSYIEIRLDKE